jgi:hypothetical protein
MNVLGKIRALNLVNAVAFEGSFAKGNGGLKIRVSVVRIRLWAPSHF